MCDSGAIPEKIAEVLAKARGKIRETSCSKKHSKGKLVVTVHKPVFQVTKSAKTREGRKGRDCGGTEGCHVAQGLSR